MKPSPPSKNEYANQCPNVSSCFSGHFHTDTVDIVGYLPNTHSLLPSQQNINFDYVSTPPPIQSGKGHLQAQGQLWILFRLRQSVQDKLLVTGPSM